MRYLVFFLAMALATPAWASASRDYPGSTNTDRVAVSADSSIHNLAPVSIALWFNVDSYDTTARRFTDKNSGSGDDTHHIFFIWTVSSVDKLEFWSLNWDSAANFGKWTVPGPSTGAWHHVVVSYAYSATTDDPTIWVDNVSQTVTEDDEPSGTLNFVETTDLIIGNSGGSHNRCFNGKLAYFSYHNTELTAVEVAESMYYPESITTESSKTFLSMWGDSPEVDLSGNGNTGSPTSTTAHVDGPPVAFMQGYPL